MHPVVHQRARSSIPAPGEMFLPLQPKPVEHLFVLDGGVDLDFRAAQRELLGVRAARAGGAEQEGVISHCMAFSCARGFVGTQYRQSRAAAGTNFCKPLLRAMHSRLLSQSARRLNQPVMAMRSLCAVSTSW